MMSMLLAWLASQIGKVLFLPEPVSVLNDEKREAFDQELRISSLSSEWARLPGWRNWKWMKRTVGCAVSVMS